MIAWLQATYASAFSNTFASYVFVKKTGGGSLLSSFMQIHLNILRRRVIGKL
jgi:hypothetical protein